jgi:formyltetrahydrofolate hydrolase
MQLARRFVLTPPCRDAEGIVQAVPGLLERGGRNIGHCEDDDASGPDFPRARAVRWHVAHRVIGNCHTCVACH